MKQIILFTLFFLVIGCSVLGAKPERIERITKYLRGYTCDLSEPARMLARMELEKQGITLKVDCDFEGRDEETATP